MTHNFAEYLIQNKNMTVENIHLHVFEYGSVKLAPGDIFTFHGQLRNIDGGRCVVGKFKTKAGVASSDEWYVEDTRIIFSFNQQDWNYLEVEHKIFSRKAYWNIYSPQVQFFFNEQVAKLDDNIEEDGLKDPTPQSWFS